ncbi:MAG: hypothetical protein ABSG84_06190 [Acidobacteriaceae bacterium]|jgi:hypothetical protein
MNERNTGDSTMNRKKIWTPPVLKTILLNSAKHGSHAGPDGGARS